jgi:DNA/RNA endonuclease G (NUC1)
VSAAALKAAALDAAAVKGLSLALLVALPSFAAAVPATPQPTTSTYSQQDLLKNWAFSVCLATVSKAAAFKAAALTAADPVATRRSRRRPAAPAT